LGLGQSRGTFYAVLFCAFDKRFGALRDRQTVAAATS
jgi:hypothetical protein